MNSRGSALLLLKGSGQSGNKSPSIENLLAERSKTIETVCGSYKCQMNPWNVCECIPTLTEGKLALGVSKIGYMAACCHMNKVR